MFPASATARNVILAGANSSRYDNSDSRLLQCFTFQPSAHVQPIHDRASSGTCAARHASRRLTSVADADANSIPTVARWHLSRLTRP
jgi:hypothetical protein